MPDPPENAPADGLAEAHARAERRRERAPRTLPPSRRAGAPVPPPAPAEAPPDAPAPVARPRRPPAPAAAPAPPHLAGLADAPTVGLTARIRLPLDRRIVGVVRALQDEGVRTSKIELIEMLIAELPDRLTPELRERVLRFRAAAGRQR